MITWTLNLLALVLLSAGAFAVVATAGIPWTDLHDKDIPDLTARLPALLLRLALVYVVYLIAAALAYLFFNARALSYSASHTGFRRVTFAAAIPRRALLWLQLGNLLILIATLGLGAAFTAHRYVRFVCAHLRLSGAEDLEALSQEPGRRRAKGGDGLVQLLDSGGFA